MLGEGTFLGNESFVDVTIVGEKPAVVAKQGGDNQFFVRRLQVVETIELVARKDEVYTCLSLLFLDVVDIAGTSENLEGRVYLNGEMMKLMAEIINAEFKSYVVAVANGHLIIV